MKELLLAVKDALQSAAGLSTIPDANIFICYSDDLIPRGVDFESGPAVGIKDGDIFRELRGLTGNQNLRYDIYTVDLVLFQLVKAGEDTVTAATPGVFSILDLAADVRAVLDNNTLGISGVFYNFSPEEAEIEPMTGTDLALLRKIVTYAYHKRVTS